MRIDKIASSAEYRMYESFRNCQFLVPNFGFLNGKSQKFVKFGQFR